MVRFVRKVVLWWFMIFLNKFHIVRKKIFVRRLFLNFFKICSNFFFLNLNEKLSSQPYHNIVSEGKFSQFLYSKLKIILTRLHKYTDNILGINSLNPSYYIEMQPATLLTHLYIKNIFVC